ncbi:Uncharacterised protein [Mycobacteroides abscessus subsp. abscessus]|nr:Uncharacterised protein [Mycobacteroides abscessus subsp. abscessus]
MVSGRNAWATSAEQMWPDGAGSTKVTCTPKSRSACAFARTAGCSMEDVTK